MDDNEDRLPDSHARRRALVLLRLTTMVATAYLLIAAVGLEGVNWATATLIGLALASNALLPRLPDELVASSRFTAGLMLVDGVLVTGVLLSSGRFGGEFFYLYFFVLFLAAIGESVRLVAVGAVVAALAFLVAGARSDSGEWALSSSALLQVPFFLAVATFYGYLVDRVRKERTVAVDEARAASELRETQGLLARRASELENEVMERRKAEERLTAANEELKRASEIKSDFVAMVAHELKGPLSAIRSALDILHQGKAGELPASQLRFVDMARRSVKRLRRITGDLLDLSKIEAGRLEFAFDAIDLRAACEDLILSHHLQADESSLILELDADEDLPLVQADSHRIAQVLTNLMTNAMKFTPAGGRVSVELRAGEDSIEVSVRDTGVGLTQEQQEKIFERFYQVPEGHRDAPRGTGLGLCISRELIEAHGGRLAVESERGRGSRFYFRLAAAASTGPEVTATELAGSHA